MLVQQKDWRGSSMKAISERELHNHESSVRCSICDFGDGVFIEQLRWWRFRRKA
jgi:hypothetical protein